MTLPVGPPDFTRSNRYNEGALYAQDTWKISRTVSLNLGLRYEYYGTQHNKNGQLDSNYYLGSGSTIPYGPRNRGCGPEDRAQSRPGAGRLIDEDVELV